MKGAPPFKFMSDSTPSGLTAREALARLKAGNERFVSGEGRFPTVQKAVLEDLAEGQQPWATILGCSDSRVPPEVVFDAHLGELFIVRVAGNVLGNSILGSLQYAGAHLKTPLFVVLGHEGCGAVQAAIAWRFEGERQKSRIELLLENIVPAVEGLDSTLPPEVLLSRGVEANVRRTMDQLLATPEAQANLATGGMRLVGAIYDLKSGRVRFIDEEKL